MKVATSTAIAAVSALCSGVLLSACCAAPRAPSEAELRSTNQYADEDAFLSVTNETSLAEVRKMLGIAVRHQFTVSDGGHRWTLIRCLLHTGRVESRAYYQMLFKDDRLLKIIAHVDWWKREDVPYRASFRSRTKPWDVEDMTGVRMALRAPALTPSQIREELKAKRESMAKYRGQGNIPLVVGVLLAPLMAPGYIAGELRDGPLNADLRARFDGCRSSLGMTVKEVDDLYGAPVYVFATATGRAVRIYGDYRVLKNVNTELRFSFVAVVFDPNGRTERVNCDLFFCIDWDPVLQQREKANSEK